jgi:hypothetical protein
MVWVSFHLWASRSHLDAVHHERSRIGPIIPTANSTVTNAHGNEIDQARRILDSGAQQCFIPKSAVQRVGLNNQSYLHIQSHLKDPTIYASANIGILLGTRFVEYITRRKKIAKPWGPEVHISPIWICIQGYVTTGPICFVVASTQSTTLSSASRPSPSRSELCLFQLQEL